MRDHGLMIGIVLMLHFIILLVVAIPCLIVGAAIGQAIVGGLIGISIGWVTARALFIIITITTG